MALKSDVKKFWKNHPFLTVIYGVVGTYIVSSTYNAITAGEGEFWGKKYRPYVSRRFNGLGRTQLGYSNPDPEVIWDPVSHRHFPKSAIMPPPGAPSPLPPPPPGTPPGEEPPRTGEEGHDTDTDMSGLYGWNQQFGGTTSTSTTTSSSHMPVLRNNNSTYGEESFESPAQFYGLPNGIKRRIMHGSIGDTDMSFTPAPELMPTVQERHGEILGYAGHLPEQLAGHGWL